MCKYKPSCVASKSHPNCSCSLSSKIDKDSFSHIEDPTLRLASQVRGFGSRFDSVGNPKADLLEG